MHITALILVLIFTPAASGDADATGALIFASVWAIASKFIFAVNRRHLFNPAALGALAAALLIDHPASWWIGGLVPLTPLLAIGGLLVLRKIRRFELAGAFLLANLVTVGLTTPAEQVGFAFNQALLSSPLLFFAFVMLTEPLTAPAGRWQRLAYAAAVGTMMAPEINIAGYYFTPELALLIANFGAFLARPGRRAVLTLERIEKSAAGAWDFIFRPERRLAFEAGQYLEWTLKLDHPDNRGNRRYFTLASAPTESEVRLGVRFPAHASAFKRSLATMQPGDKIHASLPAGDFVLPRDPRARLVFLAGGIGITPFRSMLRTLIDHGEPRPITVLYGVQCQADIAYRDVLAAAADELGIRTVFAVAEGATDGQYAGFIDARLIRAVVPDFAERHFYVSGPQVMVEAMRDTLRGLGVRPRRIKTDFFPGFV